MYNVIGVALSLGLLKMPPDTLLKSIEKMFAKKQKIAELNKHASTYSYNFASAKFTNFDYSLPGTQKEENIILVQGHQGTAIGKMVCGCRFQSYYPITPASDESVYLEEHEILDEIEGDRPGSTAVIQTEDEISAIGMMIGGALTGARSDRKSTRLNSSHSQQSRMPSSA